MCLKQVGGGKREGAGVGSTRTYRLDFLLALPTLTLI